MTTDTERAVPAAKRKKRRFVLILLAILLLFAIGITVPVCISTSRRVLTFRGIRIDRSLYAYFEAKCRYRYLVSSDFPAKADTPAFWGRIKDGEAGLTYGEDCEALTRTYVLRTVVAAYLFDESGETLSEAERTTLDTALEELLRYRFGDDKKALDEAAEPYGFSYRDVRRGYIYELKAALLSKHLSLSDDQSAGYFAKAYSRVQIVLVSPTASAAAREETARRFAEVEVLSDPDERIDLFNSRILETELNENPSYKDFKNGYYFNPAGSYDASFAEAVTKEYDGVDGEGLLAAIRSLDAPGALTAYSEGGYTFYLMREKPDLLDLSSDDYTKTMFSDFTSLAIADYLPTYLDGFATDAKWQTSHMRIWVPTGTDTKLYLFFS